MSSPTTATNRDLPPALSSPSPVKAGAAALAGASPQKAATANKGPTKHDIVKTTQGTAFNKTLTEAPLNNSASKQSFAFSKAKRFSDVISNDQGYAVAVLGGEKELERLSHVRPALSPVPSSFVKKAGSNTFQPMPGMPHARLPRNLNQQSGRSILEQQLVQDNMDNEVGEYGEEDADGDDDEQDEYGDETNQEQKDGMDLSNVDSIERLNVGGRNGKKNNTDMQHYGAKGGKMSSLDGSALRRRQRARSTVQGNQSQLTTAAHSVQGFDSSGPRFALSPH